MDALAPQVARILADPAASDWLKCALVSALARDPVDAMIDAGALAAALEEQAAVTLGLSAAEPGESS